jgi:hypothetical protein
MGAAIEGKRIVVRALLSALLERHRRAALDQEDAAAAGHCPFGEQHARDAASEDTQVRLPLTLQGARRNRYAGR